MSKAIVSPYNLSFSKDLESSFNCLQLVSFLQRVDLQKDLSFANSVNIAIVEFAITDFLRFTGKNPRTTYHREKAMSFFKNLSKLEPLKRKINDNRKVYVSKKICFRLFVCFLFSLTSEQSLNLAKMEKSDLRLLKDQIVLLNLRDEKNIFANTSEPSILYVEENSYKKDNLNPISIKTKTREEKNSIFVEGFQAIRSFPARPKLNYYDKVENRMVKPSVMLKAQLTCMKQLAKLPREIIKKDKIVKFDKRYSGLFKENYEVFGYNLYLEENLSKDSSKNKIKQGKQKLFKKYGETSKEYLRKNLFENPCIIKSEKCKYLYTDNFVTIYYDEFTDLFAIIDSKSNCLLDFGVATEVKYAEIFAYKSSGTVKLKEICLSENQRLEDDSLIPQNSESVKSKELEVYQEPYLLSVDDALAVLEAIYGENFIAVGNGEFKIQEWQATKKLVHAVCFGINPGDYGFSQDQAKEINATGGIVAYMRKGKKLPSLDLIRAYQNAIKKFCEDRTQSERDDKSTFKGEPSITFINKETRQVAIFDRETKIFITAYKLTEAQYDEYETTGNIGETNKN